MAHAEHLGSDHRDLVGPFVVGTARLDELAELATPTLFPTGLRVSVVVPSPGEVPDDRADRHSRRRSWCWRASRSSSTATGRRRTRSARSPRPNGTAPRRTSRPLGPVTRTGRTWWRPSHDQDCGSSSAPAAPRLRPSPPRRRSPTWVRDAVARSVPFKCTAGLHQAVRHTGATTGFEHHGYLNILLATARAVGGRRRRIGRGSRGPAGRAGARRRGRAILGPRHDLRPRRLHLLRLVQHPRAAAGPGRAPPPRPRRLTSRTRTLRSQRMTSTHPSRADLGPRGPRQPLRRRQPAVRRVRRRLGAAAGRRAHRRPRARPGGRGRGDGSAVPRSSWTPRRSTR